MIGAGRSGPTAYLSTLTAPHFAAGALASIQLAQPRFGADLAELVTVGADSRPLIARGAGSSGADIAHLSDGRVIDASGLDRLISFDPSAGRFRAQAGVRIDDALAYLAARGHALAVAPAWGAATLAGLVACDAHGSNHDAAGAIGGWVRAIRLHRTDRPALTLEPGDPSLLFDASIGGLGLTGVIEWIEFETIPTRSSMMRWEAEPFARFGALEELMREGQDWTHRRAWLDPFRPGFGRFERFAYAKDGPREARYPQPLLTAPWPLSRGLVNRVSAGVATGLMQRRGPAARLRDYASVLFPFEDAMEHFAWLFGRRGCAQYQAVLPWAGAFAALNDMAMAIKAGSDGLALVGVTPFGARAGVGLLSFAGDGLCVTVRMRASGERPGRLFGKLDEIVAGAGGRLNPACDARAPVGLIAGAYPKLGALLALADPAISSDAIGRLTPS